MLAERFTERAERLSLETGSLISINLRVKDKFWSSGKHRNRIQDYWLLFPCHLACE